MCELPASYSYPEAKSGSEQPAFVLFVNEV